MLQTHSVPRWLAFPCAAGAAALLILSVWGALALNRGSLAARLWVAALILFLAVLAFTLLSGEGYPPAACLPAMLLAAAALYLRVLNLDYVTLDYQDFLSQWAAFFRENGGLSALNLPVGNYNVPYLYFLAIISYLNVPDLYLIKLFSMAFDVLLAWGVLRLVRRLCPEHTLRPLWAFCATLLLPTVVLNGSLWGQCDSVFSAMAVLAVAAALDGRPKRSVVLLALAFSFKLQAIFLIPLWCAFWFTKRVRFPHLLLFPAVCAAAALPAVLLGKPVGDILSIYAGQMGVNDALNFNAPSLYGFLPYHAQVDAALWARLGILAAFVLTLLLLGWLFLRRARITDEVLVLAGAVLAIGIPFLLPYMHDRYFFLGGMLILAWAWVRPQRLVLASLAELASLSAYCIYLRTRYTFWFQLGGQIFTLALESLLMLLALAGAAVHLALLLRAPAPQRK